MNDVCIEIPSNQPPLLRQKLSKNDVSIKHLELACRHVEEMRAAGITENHAIRTLELFTDLYAKLFLGGRAVPHHVSQVPLYQWSDEAKQAMARNPALKPKDHLRVEHGTPRRAFARMVLELYRKEKLSKSTMNALARKYWKLAVITLEEDARLNKLARSKLFDTPDKRWQAAGITFST